MDRPGQNFDESRRTRGRLRRSVELLTKTSRGDEFHRQKGASLVLAGIENLHDLRMLQPSDQLGFGVKPQILLRAGMRSRRQDLQGHCAVDAALAGLIDDS